MLNGSGDGRRQGRYRLRAGLRAVTLVESCARCGEPISLSVAVGIRPDGRAVIQGTRHCKRVWLCPVCASIIRHGRAREIEAALTRHLNSGGGALFITSTMPHDFGDALEPLVGAINGAHTAMTHGRGWSERGSGDRDRYGVLGTIKAVEVTHGCNGWHPHLHSLMCTCRELSSMEVRDFSLSMFDRYAASIERSGYRRPSPEVGLVVAGVSSNGVAGYVAKVDDGGSIGSELSRIDLKRAAASHRTPFELLQFAVNDDFQAVELWHEFERSIGGVNSLRWSPGLRDRLGVAPCSDDELMRNAEVIDRSKGLVLLDRWEWWHVRSRGLEGVLLDVMEESGVDGVVSLLAALVGESRRVA